MTEAVLGLDTSNYRTSMALVSLSGEILLNLRELLPVPQGERGLRQSEAVFAHIRALRRMEQPLREVLTGKALRGVAVSVRPCDPEASYMPVFQAGHTVAALIAASQDVPLIQTTHQRGHLAAAARGTRLEEESAYLALHLSGGTTDLLEVREDRVLRLGGSLDLHAGQLVDRVGVAMGLSFPAGPELEQLAAQGISEGLLGCSMEHGDLECHFSGAEAQASRWLREGKLPREQTAREVYDLLARTTARLLCAGARETGLSAALVTGGIASSALFRELLLFRMRKSGKGPEVIFGDPTLSGDNAVGVAMTGVRAIRS